MRALLSTALLAIAACDTSQHEPINIAVYPSLQSCMVKDTPMKCEQLAAFMRDSLRVGANRDVTVSYAGTESPPKGDTSLEQIVEMLRVAGYTRARVIRFEMK